MSRTASRVETRKSRKAKVDPALDKPKETVRDFFEQIIVAIILAMLIRGFDAEAFVIPTGSMAPTLMGRHKEIACPECGLTYSINTSEDIDQFITYKQQEANRRLEDANQAPARLATAERNQQAAVLSGNRAQLEAAAEDLRRAKDDVERAAREIQKAKLILKDCHETGLCVNCRYRIMDQDDRLPSYKGDRILVMKFPYELPFLPGSGGPQRWDVVVFHFPEKPETNYIKRLVGLPGEELRISNGDILTRPPGSNGEFVVQRKPLIHQDAMQIMVYDDHYRPKAIKGKTAWNRWATVGGFEEPTDGKFVIKVEPSSDWSSLRYRHLLPDPEQWAALVANTPVPRSPKPTLITDFYSYNTNITPSDSSWSQMSEGWLQSNWVGDLTLTCHIDLDTPQPGSVARFELIEAGVSNRCEINLLTGIATLYHGEQKLGEAATSVRGTSAHHVGFANVDDRLTLWIDGQPIFEDGVPYIDEIPQPHVPTAKDLDPVGVSFKGTKVTVTDLVLKRDIYYTQEPATPDYRIPGTGDSFDGETDDARVKKMLDFLATPLRFVELKDLPVKDYTIRPDHYMMMGDNSPRSSDSRAWGSRDVAWRVEDRSTWEVPRSHLIGKAFFVFWPHGKKFGPDVRINRDLSVFFRPYLERMKWIR